MSASMTVADTRLPLQAMPGGLAGWLQRALAGQAVAAAEAAPAAAAEHAFATAWPVRREADTTMYRCRMWDGVRTSTAFFVRAPHGFLGTDPAGVLARLAAADEDAFNILRRARQRGFCVEFNQERHEATVVTDALAQLSAGLEQAPAAVNVQ